MVHVVSVINGWGKMFATFVVVAQPKKFLNSNLDRSQAGATNERVGAFVLQEERERGLRIIDNSERHGVGDRPNGCRYPSQHSQLILSVPYRSDSSLRDRRTH